MDGSSTREHVTERLQLLHTTTDPEVAYAIIDSTFPPPKNPDSEAATVGNYHAERTRRQMAAGVVGERAIARAIPRIEEYLNVHDTLVTPATTEHPVRSRSLQDFVASMDYWFTNNLTEVLQTDATAQAVATAASKRQPIFREVVTKWVEYQRKRDPDFYWELPPPRADAGKDIPHSYHLNFANEVPNQFLVFGFDPASSGLPPAELARQRINVLPAFTSTVHGISVPVMGPFVTYDPETGVNERYKDKVTLQVLYSTWENDPTPQHAEAFLALSADENVQKNLNVTASFPGTGADGRALNPGHCHVDMPIVNKETAIASRELLTRLGDTGLSGVPYLNITTMVSGVGLHVATHTLYANWPQCDSPPGL